MNRPATSPPQSDNVPITMIPRPSATCKCAPSHRVCDEFLQWVAHSLRVREAGGGRRACLTCVSWSTGTWNPMRGKMYANPGCGPHGGSVRLGT
jgi:hypothetical protein